MISITLETDLIEVLLGRRFNILVITNKEDVQINAVPLDAARVCVCVCGHVYVVYEDTNLYNDMGMT